MGEGSLGYEIIPPKIQRQECGRDHASTPGEYVSVGGRHSGGGDIYGERVALLAPLVSSQGYPLPIGVYPRCLDELDQRGQHHEDRAEPC